MNERKHLVVSTLLMTLVLSVVAVSAWGRGFGRGPGGRGEFGGEPGFGPGPRGGGLVMRLLFPCKGDCFDAARTCFEAAESDALTCAQSTCADQITAGQGACADDLSSEGCRTARNALVDCLDPCLATKRTALGACHATADTCVDGCAE